MQSTSSILLFVYVLLFLKRFNATLRCSLRVK